MNHRGRIVLAVVLVALGGWLLASSPKYSRQEHYAPYKYSRSLLNDPDVKMTFEGYDPMKVGLGLACMAGAGLAVFYRPRP